MSDFVINNEHILYLLKQLKLSSEYITLCNYLESADNKIQKKGEDPKKPGFDFEYTENGEVITGHVRQAAYKRKRILNDFPTRYKLNKCKDDKEKFCALALLLALRKWIEEEKKNVSLNLIPLFAERSFCEMVNLLAENLTENFTELRYTAKDKKEYLLKSGDVLAELKPWGCTVYYIEAKDPVKKTENGKNEEDPNGKSVFRDLQLDNTETLKKELSEEIVRSGKEHPLVRLFLSSESPENINEQFSLLQTALKIKEILFSVQKLSKKSYHFIPGSIRIKKYVSKIISGIYKEFQKAIAEDCTKNERTVVDAENALAEFAFSRCYRPADGVPEFKNKDLAALFSNLGIIKLGNTEWHFCNPYIKWIYAALYLCKNYFNEGILFIPTENAVFFPYYSVYENIFHSIKYFLALNGITSSKDTLVYGTVFGTAITSLLYNEKRNQFISYLCEVAKDFSCSVRADQELAISILCMALNECLDSIDAALREKAFKRCYSKTSYRIQQESFLLLKPASAYFENTVKNCFDAYIAKNNNEPITQAQPFFYFYYHHLPQFEIIFKKVEKALRQKWNEKWTVQENELLGVALAIRELSWRQHNQIQTFQNIDSINAIIRLCISLIPLEKDVTEYSKKREYALAVESIAYTLANRKTQLNVFLLNKTDEDEQKGCRKLMRLIFTYDLFMRKNNNAYNKYLASDYINIEGVPDGFLVCGMIRVFSYKQKSLPLLKIDEAAAWERILKKERGRYKILIARALDYTNFYNQLGTENKTILSGIAKDLKSSDFLPYDNIDIYQLYANEKTPSLWYSKESDRDPCAF